MTEYVVDPLAEQLEIRVSARRCRHCYPGSGTGKARHTQVRTTHLEATWQKESDAGPGFAWKCRPDHRAGESVSSQGFLPAHGRSGGEADRRVAEALVEIHESGWQGDVADRLATKLGEPIWRTVSKQWKVSHCEALAAVADLLDLVYKTIQSGISTAVRLVVRWCGAPELVAALIGELVARAVVAHFLYPLKTTAQTLRVVGALACPCNGHPGSCACVKALAKQVLLEELKQTFLDAVDCIHVEPTKGNATWIGFVATFEYLHPSPVKPTVPQPDRPSKAQPHSMPDFPGARFERKATPMPGPNTFTRSTFPADVMGSAKTAKDTTFFQPAAAPPLPEILKTDVPPLDVPDYRPLPIVETPLEPVPLTMFDLGPPSFARPPAGKPKEIEGPAIPGPGGFL